MFGLAESNTAFFWAGFGVLCVFFSGFSFLVFGKGLRVENVSHVTSVKLESLPGLIIGSGIRLPISK